MRDLLINKRAFSYCLFDRIVEIQEDGEYTGDKIPIHKEAVSINGNISPAKGEAQIEQFGNNLEYEKVIVIDDMNCPIDENTVLFVDKEPEYGEEVIIGYEPSEEVGGEPTPITYKPPLFDYVVKRVAKSLSHISLAIARVDVS